MLILFPALTIFPTPPNRCLMEDRRRGSMDILDSRPEVLSDEDSNVPSVLYLPVDSDTDSTRVAYVSLTRVLFVFFEERILCQGNADSLSDENSLQLLVAQR
ncbi:hypothetical protein PoB_000470600 [Plakobranchus ocellatus]|uniref:Uncharacterized protein n=1 Tax=Plakobranchus ocellatus TaxID=259542 RepID=A0AAV3XS52_9GAST|nr:hypothetical protein PoB_000470600 [Plakobranchus ocellatus]